MLLGKELALSSPFILRPMSSSLSRVRNLEQKCSPNVGAVNAPSVQSPGTLSHSMKSRSSV